MNNIVKVTIFLILGIALALLISGFVAGYPAYYNVELEGLLDRMEETIIAQDRELTRVGNSLKLQIAYTEQLKIVLEANGIEYERYPYFLNHRIFREGQLDDPEFLYTTTLDLEYLLIMATNLGGLIDAEGKYITPEETYSNSNDTTEDQGDNSSSN